MIFKVYAISNESGEKFALKMCHSNKSRPGAVEQLENECCALRKLKRLTKHDKSAPIPMFYYSGELLDLKVIVIEYIDGKTVSSLDELDRDVQNECIQSLSWLHSKSRLHGDVRPANFIVKNDGNVNIIDLGLSSETNDSKAKENEIKYLLSFCSKATQDRSSKPSNLVFENCLL